MRTVPFHAAMPFVVSIFHVDDDTPPITGSLRSCHLKVVPGAPSKVTSLTPGSGSANAMAALPSSTKPTTTAGRVTGGMAAPVPGPVWVAVCRVAKAARDGA